MGPVLPQRVEKWSLLTALSGFSYSAPERELRFRPRVNQSDFRCLYSSGTSWGSYSQKLTPASLDAQITLEGGVLELLTLRLPYLGSKAKLAAPVPAKVTVKDAEATIRFASALLLKTGDRLRVSASESRQ